MPEPTVNDQSSSSEPGFFGKLPVYGDFIHKRLPRDFITPWDDWLQVGLAAALGEIALLPPPRSDAEGGEPAAPARPAARRFAPSTRA